MTFLKEGHPAFGDNRALYGTHAGLLHHGKTVFLCGVATAVLVVAVLAALLEITLGNN